MWCGWSRGAALSTAATAGGSKLEEENKFNSMAHLVTSWWFRIHLMWGETGELNVEQLRLRISSGEKWAGTSVIVGGSSGGTAIVTCLAS